MIQKEKLLICKKLVRRKKKRSWSKKKSIWFFWKCSKKKLKRKALLRPQRKQASKAETIYVLSGLSAYRHTCDFKGEENSRKSKFPSHLCTTVHRKAGNNLNGLGLTRITWLIHTSVLPSNWNLGKFFVLTGELGQVHMAKKLFPIFLHAGKGLFLILNLWFSSKLVSKVN